MCGGHSEILNLTWAVSCSLSAAWICWLCLLLLSMIDAFLSWTLWGVTLPVLLEFNPVCPLLGNPPHTDPGPLAWLSWALIRSFSLLSWAISASMASGEISEPRGSDNSETEEAKGRLERGRLVRLDAELSLRGREAFAEEHSCCDSAGWLTEKVEGKGAECDGIRIESWNLTLNEPGICLIYLIW